jgi:hypothetical protein
MKIDYKYTFIYTIICIILFYLIVKWGHYLIRSRLICKNNDKEGFSEFEQLSYKLNPYPKDAVINYNDVNSPLYSHTVNLPINDPYSCKNFCGPKSQCAITREQCTSDLDCQGCQPPNKPVSNCSKQNIKPYEDSGKLGPNLTYSSLTSGYNNYGMDFEEIYPGSKDAEIKKPYQGLDIWTDSFNAGLNMYNKKRETNTKYKQLLLDKFSENPAIHAPKYPTTVTATGQFYNTIAPASNAYLQ